ncbi:MAG: hypothetical protein WAV21_01625 [Minisyncoccia bacterium]
MEETKKSGAAPFEQKNASYGALISIVLILAIIVVGAFYTWGERIAKTKTPIDTSTFEGTASESY